MKKIQTKFDLMDYETFCFVARLLRGKKENNRVCRSCLEEFVHVKENGKDVLVALEDKRNGSFLCVNCRNRELKEELEDREMTIGKNGKLLHKWENEEEITLTKFVV